MRRCSNCGSDKTYVSKTGHVQWTRGLCKKCYNKLIVHPKWNSIHNTIYNPRHLRWTPTGGIVLLKENPRKGICLSCGRKGRTSIHHFGKYDEKDPLKDTIELCVSCHNKEGWKLDQLGRW